jgi:amidase
MKLAPWSEHVLIEIGYGYEQATKHRRPPPTTPPL